MRCQGMAREREMQIKGFLVIHVEDLSFLPADDVHRLRLIQHQVQIPKALLRANPRNLSRHGEMMRQEDAISKAYRQYVLIVVQNLLDEIGLRKLILQILPTLDYRLLQMPDLLLRIMIRYNDRLLNLKLARLHNEQPLALSLGQLLLCLLLRYKHLLRDLVLVPTLLPLRGLPLKLSLLPLLFRVL